MAVWVSAPWLAAVAETDLEAVAERGRSERRTTVFRGQDLSYTVVGGMAVHAGDIMLGPADELTGPSGKGLETGDGRAGRPARREMAPVRGGRLWPAGILPYVIDADITGPQLEAVEEAVAAWADQTVIAPVARTNEADYVRFGRVASGNCRSHVGMTGGEQLIALPPAGCSAHALMHEIGHAVGLWHEHQRTDRAERLVIGFDKLNPVMTSWYLAEHPGEGRYDYASVMHYHPMWASAGGAFVMETVPPGIHIPAAGISQGDIDGVARLYGKPPTAVTISTNPQGMEVRVDGIPHVTPASFDWPAGTVHTIEPPLALTEAGTRYAFGRWNTGGNRVRYVIAGKVETWLEANYIVQHLVEAGVAAGGDGQVVVQPPSVDGFYTLRTPVSVEAVPAKDSGARFWRWGGNIEGGLHGRSANPARWAVDRPRRRFTAYFSEQPLFRISATEDPFLVHIDGQPRLGPIALLPEEHPDPVTLAVDELRDAPGQGLIRHRFGGWSSGQPISHAVVLAPEGAEIRAEIIAETPVSVAVSEPSGGSVHVEPESDDGYYALGQRLHLTALPAAGWQFSGWYGGLHSDEASVTVALTAPLHAEAQFVRGYTDLGPSSDGESLPSLAAGLEVPAGALGGPRQRATSAWPPALAFVAPSSADPAPQRVRVQNRGPRPASYTVESDGGWLVATPRQLRLESGEAMEIEVRVAGGGMMPETHSGRLVFRAAGVAAAAVEVTFVSLPGQPRTAPSTR